MDRIGWQQLPDAVRWAVTECTGTVRSITHAADGANSAIALRLAAESGDYFVKGIPTDHPQAATQNREAEINPARSAALWAHHRAVSHTRSQ